MTKLKPVAANQCLQFTRKNPDRSRTIRWFSEVGPARIRRWAGFIDEPKSSKESRLRRLGVFCRQLRSILSEAGKIAIPPPAQKTFDAEGEALERALTKSFRIRNEAIKSLCSRYADFGMRPSRKNAKAIIRTLFRHCGKR